MPRNQKQQKRTPVATKPLIQPGYLGLNTEIASGSVAINDQWASNLTNFVFDELGRIVLRKGYQNVTTTPITGTPEVVRVYEYIRTDETTSIIAVTDAFTIWESTDNGDTWTNISGDFTTNLLASTEVRFATLDGILYATAPGFKVYQFTTALGSFQEIATSQPTRGVIHSAYGRIWVAEDATDVVNYSGLLDGSDWTSTSAGSIDAANVWTNGQDTIKAIASFGASLLLFGTEHVIIYVDGAGSELGVDPNNLYVVDTIEGTGCRHPDSIINIGEGDLWFMSDEGVQSLARVIEEKVNPLVDISKNVRSLIEDQLDLHVGSTSTIQGIYTPENRICIFNFPEQNVQVIFDVQFGLEDGTYRAAQWDLPARALLRRRNGDVNFGLDGGILGLYTDYRDLLAAIVGVYSSPWMNFDEQFHSSLKIPKSFGMFISGRGTITGTARWGFDFRPLEYSQAWTNEYIATGAEWGSGEYAEDDFGDGIRMRNELIAGAGQGQFIRFYTTVQTDVDAKISIQEIDIRAKIGRRTE